MIQLSEDIIHRFPTASLILKENMYVDDVLAGEHTISAAIDAKNELVEALETAGFSLRKWTANSKDILADFPPNYLLRENFLDFDDKSTAKTLGIRWNASSDSFLFVPTVFSESSRYTKREVFSQISKLFDPAGWLAPCVVLAKILMQHIWIEGTGWDERITNKSLAQWKSIQSNYHYIQDIRIPRWLNFSPNCTVQFHGFCDASEKAYAAVLYIRVVCENRVYTHLVTAKTRVAPIKTISIPRLELCGAVLLAEMLDSILSKLKVKNYETYCWTDSTIVLSWLAKSPCTWLTFVANRISKIVQIIDPIHWRHISSENNPADIASRGMLPPDIINKDLWWKGPEFIQNLDFQHFHQNVHVPDTDLEQKPIKVNFSYFKSFEDEMQRFSSFARALRVFSYIYRFFYRTHPKFKESFSKTNYILTTFEIKHVRDQLIKMYQKAFYPDEYKRLADRKSIPSTSKLLNLNPFLDPEGIIRSCGRLESSPDLSYNEKHPILLPYDCQYSKLLVKFVHAITLHGGNQLVLRIIRTQYWIPKVKNLIKSTIHSCKPCIIYKKRCQKQIMSALPPERSCFSRPFTHTGLDFAGPFDIKTYSGRNYRITKGYVCLFICFSTKAIHLEATSDLSTSTFLAAFHRFVSRRGCPIHLYSDNGTTFVGASKILAREFMQNSQQIISRQFQHQNITWNFIPPGAPHMGGLWEAGVKSFKSHFRKVAKDFKFTFEEFCTLISRIEACLNSRPLSPASHDPSDLSVLTPGHFLIGMPILAPIDPAIQESRASLINRWEKIKLVQQNFCNRWKNEYLKELQKRIKWQKPEENVKENTLVVIKDENLPPNACRLGRIHKTYLGSDNRVRVADILTQKGMITRPIVKLVPLSSD
ncbi:hypothetical protein EVAR_100643_1 [Eumeta japonica]|uniref:Integrase catalytic domain-containing protein n=1 Tax=Eumeta variegata TaxID=151549 RepID=A0A4C1T3J5_EUMVA|nr:hypothetical protein EVAR_100643_1 [Eumeta japonica]